MSLFKVTVLLPSTLPVEGLALGVDELLAPYEITNAWGNHDPPPPPDVVCRCGYVRARHTAQAIADELHPKPARGSVVGNLEQLMSSMTVYRRAFELQLRHDLHASDCPICSGTGRYPDDLEPKPKFDGVVYGGVHVDGWICGEARARDLSKDTLLEDNLTTVAELLARRSAGHPIVTYALVTPEAAWYEVPLSWSLATERERETYEEGFLARLEQHRECWAVGVECHI